MNEQRSCVAYLTQEVRRGPVCLSVADLENNKFYSFPISLQAIARLAMESSEIVNAHLGGMNPKFDLQEMAQALSIAQEKAKDKS